MNTPDFIVVGAGSSGCVLAAELARRQAGSILLLEAGPSAKHPLVSMPFGLVWLMGSKRDWAFKTTPQTQAGNRQIKVPRGRMVGGSGSINSMVWFRGRAQDFDDWAVEGWTYQDVEPAFKAVEAKLRPVKMQGVHPLSKGLETLFGMESPTPETESAGVFSHNMLGKSRNSAAKAFLGTQPDVTVQTTAEVDRILFHGDKAKAVRLVDGSEIKTTKGVVLCAGSLGSPAILMRSGIGPTDDLASLGIETRLDAPSVGENLHDHPGIGLHFEGSGSGYGLEPKQWPQWALAPFRYALLRSGPLASPTVEAGAFFNARGNSAAPDVQSHFIPFHLAHKGSRFQMKSGYFADVCLCRPKSRGCLKLAAKDPKAAPHIDLGLFSDDSDLDTMMHGMERLRKLLQDAKFGSRRAPEVFPTEQVQGETLKEHIRNNAGTAYHPVGTLAMGSAVSSRLQLKGVDNIWVADASVMPSVTSANTNAPSMMIGWRGAEFIASDAG